MSVEIKCSSEREADYVEAEWGFGYVSLTTRILGYWLFMKLKKNEYQQLPENIVFLTIVLDHSVSRKNQLNSVPKKKISEEVNRKSRYIQKCIPGVSCYKRDAIQHKAIVWSLHVDENYFKASLGLWNDSRSDNGLH